MKNRTFSLIRILLMKRQTFFFLLITIPLISYGASSRDSLSPILAAQTLPTDAASLGIIPDSVFYFDLVLQPTQHSWQEYDHYYRIVLPQYHSNQAYTENLKKATLSGIIQTGKLAEIKDMQVLEWYTEEWLSLPLADPDISIKWLQALKGYWSDTKIQQRAVLAHQNLVQYVQEKLKDPVKVLAENEARYQRLKDFAASFE